MLGYFIATIVERPTSDVVAIGCPVVQALESDLPELESLLAVDGDHDARLRQGDVCLAAWVDGHPAGLLWVNLHSHVDTYIGKWSRPSPKIVYYNQLRVASKYRRQGIAKSLIVAAIGECSRRGPAILRAAVLSDNLASIGLHEALGFRPTTVVRGVRAGPLTIRLPGSVRPGGR